MIRLPSIVVRSSSTASRLSLFVIAVAMFAPDAHAFVPPNKRVEAPRGEMVYVAATTFKFLKEGKWGGAVPGTSPGYGGNPEGYATSVNAFYIDRLEVTAGAYESCVKSGACAALDKGDAFAPAHTVICTYGKPGFENHPINCVDFNEASKYCGWVGKRLPSEPEWELAARGTTGRAFPWGDAYPEPRHVNACDGSLQTAAQTKLSPPESYNSMWADSGGDDGWPFTAPVGTFPDGASPFGVLDMSGNVEEWVSDQWWELTTTGPPPKTPAAAGGIVDYVIRGGAWDLNSAESFATTHRSPQANTTRSAWLGFRCARDA
jgi:formylglycine-generating enzyme required for sulfatase activity